jgi:hypothetical protein
MGASALQVYGSETATRIELPVRGVAWVLRWAAVVTVLSYSAIVLAAFSYHVSAEHALHQATKIGLREAALPWATSESVETVIRQQLSARHPGLRAASLQLTAGGRRLHGPLRFNEGERLAVSLSVATADFVPRWLTLLTGESVVVVRGERRLGAR